MNASDGSVPTNLSNNSGIDIQPNFSPGGSKIAFTSDRKGNGDIYRMHSDGSDPVRLTKTAGPEEDPAYSPDGTRIAFASGNAIYKMHANGSGKQRVSHVGELSNSSEPDWGVAQGS